MVSIAMLHSALDALCVDRSMPVEPLFQTTFVYLILATLVIIFSVTCLRPFKRTAAYQYSLINGKLSPLPLSAVAAKGLAGLRVIRSGKPRGIFIIEAMTSGFWGHITCKCLIAVRHATWHASHASPSQISDIEKILRLQNLLWIRQWRPDRWSILTSSHRFASCKCRCASCERMWNERLA